VFPVNILHAKAEELGLKYLVIGGHAVNAYGIPRTTIDVDFLVQREERDRWMVLLNREGFSLAHDGGNFLQFSPPYGTEWNLDLMLVNDSTFTKLQTAAKQVHMLGIATFVPSVEHLISLKLHALRFGPPHRYDKDLVDVLTLIRATEIDVHAESFKEIIEQFGTPEIYERILKATSPG
jgi:predicted nucleotidyltransferase